MGAHLGYQKEEGENHLHKLIFRNPRVSRKLKFEIKLSYGMSQTGKREPAIILKDRTCSWCIFSSKFYHNSVESS